MCMYVRMRQNYWEQVREKEDFYTFSWQVLFSPVIQPYKV